MTFGRLRAVSFCHSAIYLALLCVAFAAGKPEPATFVLGMAHGLLWIGMALACLWAARRRVIPFWLAVTVAVIGGLGPFAGSIGFVIEQRRRGRSAAPAPAGTAGGVVSGVGAGAALDQARVPAAER